MWDPRTATVVVEAVLKIIQNLLDHHLQDLKVNIKKTP